MSTREYTPPRGCIQENGFYGLGRTEDAVNPGESTRLYAVFEPPRGEIRRVVLYATGVIDVERIEIAGIPQNIGTPRPWQDFHPDAIGTAFDPPVCVGVGQAIEVFLTNRSTHPVCVSGGYISNDYERSAKP